MKRFSARHFAPLLLAAIALTASAQQHPNQEKGFHADKAYSSADLDHVNLFNGNLNVAIPLGQRYRVSSALDYGFSLVYSGNNWDTEYGTALVPEHPCTDPGSGPDDTCWKNKRQDYTVPYRRSSAGLGWTLSLGRLWLFDVSSGKCDSCIVYQSPDGGEHVFLTTLHHGDPDPNANYGYTNDNTYLRIRGGQFLPFYVDFPNGSTYTFSQSTGELQSMADKFGNSVNITYSTVTSPDSASCGTADVRLWHVVEGNGRYQDVYFRRDLAPYTGDGVACRADLAAFNNARAIYKLHYTPKTISRQYTYTQTDNPEDIGNAATAPLLTQIELPDSAGSYTAVYDIGLKANGGTVVGLTSDDTDTPDRLSDPVDGLNPGSYSGHLISLRMPTKATLHWTYRNYALAIKPPPPPEPTEPVDLSSNRVAGVKTRSVQLKDSDASSNWAQWLYNSVPSGDISITTVKEPVTQTTTTTYFSICDAGNRPPALQAEYGLPVYRLATPPAVQSSSHGPYFLPSGAQLKLVMNGTAILVSLPSGTQTVDQIVTALNQNNSFNVIYYAENYHLDNLLNIRTAAVGSTVSFQIDGSVASSAHNALGLDTNSHSGTTSNVEDNHYLSSEVTDSNGTVLKRAYVSYEMDSSTGSCYCGFGAYDLNRRISGETVLTYPPSGTPDRAITDYSDFDNLGHYRTVTTGGNFASGNVRSVTTAYNQADAQVDSSAYALSNTNCTYNPIQNWILDTYSSKTTTEGSVSSKANFWFDTCTGFLQRQRVLASGTSHGANDSIVRFTQTDGNVTREAYFGGDPTPSNMLDNGESAGAGLNTSSPLSAITLTDSSAAYRMDHTYDHGVLRTSKYVVPSTGADMPFLSVNQTVDANTGLVASEADSAGAATSYSYDKLSRVTATTPPTGLTPTTITYHDPTTSTNASVDVSTSPLASHIDYDGLGRVILEWTKQPSGNWSVVSTDYDNAGRKSHVSTAEESTALGSPPSFTRFTTYTYDSLGRVSRVTAPDNKYIDTSYQGARGVTRTVKVQTSATGTQDGITTETYDRQGRLYQVSEPVGTSTTYTYDVGSRIAQVAMTSGTTQNRYFTYDNRGLLKQETHPESGTTQWSYDAKGHPLTKYLADHSRFNARYTYDAAERMTVVKSYGDWLSNPAAWFVEAKKFTFGTANVGNDLNQGKLVSALRHNWSASGSDVQVNESYNYTGLAGRLTAKTTEITRVPASGSSVLLQKFSQAYDHDALGQLTTITYPTCIDSSRPCGQTTWDSISQTFGIGRLTAIAGKRGATSFPIVTDISYHPNGMPNQITHSNSMADVQTPDSGMPRPASIEFRGYSDCTPPSITTPPQNATIQLGQTATLTLVVSGTGSLTYKWYAASDVSASTPLSTSAQPEFAVSPTQTSQYYVVAYDACGRVSTQSTPTTVTVNTCTAPAITSQPAYGSVPAYNQSATISVTASGTGLHYEWFQGDAPNAGVVAPGSSDSSTYITPAMTSTKHYWVRVHNDCGPVNSTTVVVYVTLPAPTALLATWNQPNGITVQWTASAGADHYVVERRSGGGFLVLTSAGGTSVTDNTSLAGDTTYIYRVRSYDATSESSSAYSNYDLATTTTMNALNFVSFADIDQIRLLVNRVYAATSHGALTWTDVMSGYATPPPQSGGIVDANHILALRVRMNDALSQAGVATPSYSTVASDSIVSATAWTELRGRAQ